MKISQKAVFSIGLGVVGLIAILYSLSRPLDIKAAQPEMATETLVIITKDSVQHLFSVEIANTPLKEQIGLMYRKHMEDSHGMLFEFTPERHVSFWMKNTILPLDMLFIAADGTIKTIHENAEPQSTKSIPSGVPVTGVLELNAGRVKALGIQPGDQVLHPFFKKSE